MAKGRGKNGGNPNPAKELTLFLKNRMWREHSYVLISIVGIVIALFTGSFVQFSYSKDHIYRLEVTDELMMKRVFHSGEPWVVLCAKPDDLIPDIFTKASERMTKNSFVGVADCTQVLPVSGKTLLARYGIKTSISPTIFTVANGENPKQIFLNYLQSSKALSKRVLEQTTKKVREIQNSVQLEARCLQKPKCILLLRGKKWEPYEKQWIERLMNEHRTISFAWVDAKVLQLSIESMLPAYVPGEHRLVVFKKQRDPKTKKSTLSAKAYRNLFDFIPVQHFLQDHIDKQLKVLSKAPTLSRRNSSNIESKGKYKQQRKERKETSSADQLERDQSENTVEEKGDHVEEVIDLDS